MKTALLLHGYMGDQNSSFFSAFIDRYKHACNITCLQMPNKDAPQLAEWLEDIVHRTDSTTYDLCIGHSLGGTFAMQLVSQGVMAFNTLFVVGSSFGPKDSECMNSFLSPPLNIDKLKAINQLYAVHSFDDPATDIEYGILTVKQLDAVGLFYSDQGHFLENTIPEDIKTLLDAVIDLQG